MKLMLTFLLLCMISFALPGCNAKEAGSLRNDKLIDKKTGRGTFVISAPIVRKSLITTAGKDTGIKEYYIRRSIQDYFIKFCESKVKKETVEQYLSTNKDPYRIYSTHLTLEIEFKKGNWDNCDNTTEKAGRTGEYVIIHRIVAN